MLLTIFIFIIFHMIDRQTEYISRVDYMYGKIITFKRPSIQFTLFNDRWKQQLQKKKLEADITKDTIKVLVQNILPVHVGTKPGQF